MEQGSRLVLRYEAHQPSEDTGFLYQLDVIELPGCRAWGSTEAEALDYLYDVAGIFLDSYKELGKSLPGRVEQVQNLQLVPVA